MNDIYYECGDGWKPLILEAQELIDRYNKEHPDEIKLEFTQIKEKWGGLRIYLNYYPDNFDDILFNIEKRSWEICENCGTTKNVKREYTNGWVRSLCDDCRKKELKS